MIVGAAVLTGAALFLLPRPLTSLLLFTIGLSASPLVVAIAVLRHRRPENRFMAGAILLIATAMSIVFVFQYVNVVRAVPFVLASALVCAPAWALTGALRRHRIAASWSKGIWLIAGCATAVMCVLWQDLAALSAGYATSAGFLAMAVWCACRGLRGSRQLGRLRPYLSIPIASFLALITVAATIGSLIVLVPTWRGDAFYDYAESVPEPGTLLKTEPYLGDVPAGASALRILYSTTYADGSPAVASAVLAIPDDTADGNRPVMAWQHGTTGIARSCAPSLLPDALSEVAIPGIEGAIQRGWVVVATDYPGQGTGGRYPYLIGAGEGRATLDAIRAARAVDGTHASGDVLLWGHSQGGHATLWAGQIAGTYAPDLRIVAVAALSAASDPLTEAQTVLSAGVVSSVVTPYLLLPYADEYSDVQLSDTVHPAGIGVVEAMASRCAFDSSMLASVISAAAVAPDAPQFTIDLSMGAAHDRLKENKATGLVPAPLFMGQGEDDEVVPITMQRKLAASVQAAGRPVEVREYPGRSHMGAIAPDSPLIDDLFRWADATLSAANG